MVQTSENVAAPCEELVGARIRIKDAGGLHTHFVLVAEYQPRRSSKQKRRIQSNNPRYGKSWSSKEEITLDDKVEFANWINAGLAQGGGSKLKSRGELPIRSSNRMLYANVTRRNVVALTQGLHVEPEVLECVEFLVYNTIYKSRHDGEGLVSKVNHVIGKRRHVSRQLHIKTRVISAPQGASPPRRGRPGLSGMTTRMRRAVKLNQRKSKSRSYQYREKKLRCAEALKNEGNLQWLEANKMRLATLVARQQMSELLPEGAALCHNGM